MGGGAVAAGLRAAWSDPTRTRSAPGRFLVRCRSKALSLWIDVSRDPSEPGRNPVWFRVFGRGETATSTN